MDAILVTPPNISLKYAYSISKCTAMHKLHLEEYGKTTRYMGTHNSARHTGHLYQILTSNSLFIQSYSPIGNFSILPTS